MVRKPICWAAFRGDRRADRFDAKAAEALLADARLLIETDAAKAYFEAVYLAKAITETQRRAALLDERLEILNRRFDLGLIDRPALNAAQRARDESQHLVKQLVEARAGTARRMAFLWEKHALDMPTRYACSTPDPGWNAEQFAGSKAGCCSRHCAA
ncbi:MAG: TolC family protein [Sphingomonadales bacterium]|nr:TolC family protein [Sphingomonadales bacterium]